MMLADLGADVLKVERPHGGDDTRSWGPPFAADGLSAYFRAANRNKRSIALDLDAPDDRLQLRTLLAEADVVVDNFLPGMLARRSLDPDALLHEFPTLIWCTISGFGPHSARPGYDFIVQAEAGWMAITGPVDGAPHKVGTALVDVIAGKDAAIAILAALAARGRPGANRRLHIALQTSATAALANVAQNVLVSGREAARWGNAHPNLVPYQLFDTTDRPLVVAVGTDAQWLACAKVLVLPTELAHGLWRTNAGRVADRERLVQAMQEVLGGQASAIWMDTFARAGVPCGVVQSVADALTSVGADPLFGPPPATGGTCRHPAPQLDADGALVRTHGWRAFSASASAHPSPAHGSPSDVTH